jgi:hypothetical protein
MSASYYTPSSYVQRAIDITFTRANGTFSDGGTNTATVSGLRISATITQAGGPGFNQLDCRIFGLTPSMQNDLSTLGMVVMIPKRNTISLYAGDTQSGLGLAFAGTINSALQDFRSMPEVHFHIQAQTGLTAALQPISPSSYQNGADVVVLLEGLANQMGFSFENHGVSGVLLSNPYYGGTATQQARIAAHDAGINMILDNNTMVIWPAGGVRDGVIPLISPDNGLVGYPTYTANGLDFVCVYNPTIQFGGQVQIQSSLPQATGIWQVCGMSHNLEAQMPGGSWFSSISVVTPGYYSRPL